MPNSSKRKRIAIGTVFPLATGFLLSGMLAKLPTHSLPRPKEFPPMMPNDLKELLRAFNDHGVKYLVVGGYAYGIHAEPRATKDLDIFIRSDEENSQAVFRALAQFGAPMSGLSQADFMDGSTFQIGQPPASIDLLQRVDDLSFDEAWKNRVDGIVDGEIRIMIISKSDLIRNKLASGREQDILDVKMLRTPPKDV